ncbi:response regulator [Thermomonas mangrovi]|uniref:response regulator n=1 Tax=Thermomonas mangrovi TaxID=2993316 RepID=UPI0023074963|nr:response regulator transcription factor [Thermomonas mangrovi]
MIRIVMADDHAIVRAGFRALIEQEPGFGIVAECSAIADTREAVLLQHPDVLVLDLSLPGGGLSLVPELREALPDMAILVLSMHDHEPWISEALRRGVTGYVTKGAASDELVAALRAVAAGQPYLSSDLQQPAAPRAGLEALSEREQEVFLRLARGEPPKQAAIEMGISDKTVYLHRASLRAKLGVNNDLALHKLALERGLLG